MQLEEKFATEQKAAVRKKELIEKLQKMAEEEKQVCVTRGTPLCVLWILFAD